MRSRFAIFVAVGLGSLVVASAQDSAKVFGAPAVESFRDSIRQHPYVAEKTRVEKFTAGARRLERCNNVADVRVLLGEPDFGGTTRADSDPAGTVSGAVWVYVLHEQDGEYNPGLLVLFDRSGRLTSMLVEGIDGLESIRGDNSTPCT